MRTGNGEKGDNGAMELWSDKRFDDALDGGFQAEAALRCRAAS